MDAAEVVDQFRSDVNDVAEPKLWPDEEVFRYLDDAQKMFCRLGGGLGDATTPAITALPVTIGNDTLKLHPSILKFRDAYTVSDGQPIEIINYKDFRRLGLRWDGSTGPVRYVVIGMQPHHARLYPNPTVTDTIQTMVDRLPLESISVDDTSAELEIDEQHHPHLTLWMRHRAYAKQDSETYDKQKSADFEAQFRAYCALAFEEKNRAMHKTRVVEYGGL